MDVHFVVDRLPEHIVARTGSGSHGESQVGHCAAFIFTDEITGIPNLDSAVRALDFRGDPQGVLLGHHGSRQDGEKAGDRRDQRLNPTPRTWLAGTLPVAENRMVHALRPPCSLFSQVVQFNAGSGA
jgi:hypothetical protein